MVYKIRFIILFIISVILCVLGFVHKGNIETNLLKTLLPKQTVNSADMISVANKSSSVIKIVFESDNQSDLYELKQRFSKKIDNNYFVPNKPDVRPLLDKYIEQPANFLSEQTRKLLSEKKYDKVYDKSIQNLYNPAGIQLNTLDRDPYLLLDDFITSNMKFLNAIDYYQGKYYDFTTLKIKNDEALSPNLCNKEIKKLINIQKELSNKRSKIYLAGAPIHSYYASERSITDINIICILSTLMIVFLTYGYFKNLKLLFQVALSITFGMLCGYIATKFWFDSFQIITMVFSTTLIGIGIDYSYHYFFADSIDKNFIKNISFSLLTTVVPFILLYFTGIELLQQVAIFTIFGLTGIYAIVLFIYPCFKRILPIKIYNPTYNLYKICLIIILVLSIAGLQKFHFNDSLNALYNPSKMVSNAEKLYDKISGENFNTRMIVIKGDNIDKIIETEEKITKGMNTEYIALAKFFPSEQKQHENFNLVKDLYNSNLSNYSNILSKKQISDLKNMQFTPVKFNDIYFKDFMLDLNTSIMLVSGSKKLNLPDKNAHIVNIQSDIKQYLKDYRHLLLCLFPAVIILLYILLICLYDFKKAFRILLPSVVGIVCSLLLTSLIYGELNLFSIVTIYLVLGFTIDYSIFRINAEEKTESAVFVSCVTTSFSFLLLALCGFKMLSSMALVLLFGIVVSYIIGYLLFKNRINSNENN